MRYFYEGRRVFVTGHTGFKGAWLCHFLRHLGAEVMGYALPPPTTPSLFAKSDLEAEIESVMGDVRDAERLRKAVCAFRPEIVFHLAAQPIVREGYRAPRETYETNVMGTVNLLEAVRVCPTVRSVVNVTTDKVYRNDERGHGFREEEPLNGYDPYSNSKSCADLLTQCYRRSFLSQAGIALSVARAGNVVGGGDFAANRIVPDCLRAMERGEAIFVRNPNSVRPYQHVLEPLHAYLTLAWRQFSTPSLQGEYNVGPEPCDCVTTEALVSCFCRLWGEGATWERHTEANAPHEAGLLRLDCAKIRETFGWKPRWRIETAMAMVCRFAKRVREGASPKNEARAEIEDYLGVRE